MVPNQYDLSSILPAVTRFTDTARSGVLPPNTAATFPWLEKTSAGSDRIYGGYYMSAGTQRQCVCVCCQSAGVLSGVLCQKAPDTQKVLAGPPALQICLAAVHSSTVSQCVSLADGKHS